MSHEFTNEAQIEVDATPEQVWDAITTGPGIQSWFMGHTDVVPGPSGTVSTDMGGGYISESQVTAWEPNRRFGYRMPERPDGSFLALEWLIEGRAGASTVVRSVGSGFIGADDWETEYESMVKGGRFYLHNLSEYVNHFAGRPATLVAAGNDQQGSDPAHVWTVLRGGLGLADGATVGDKVQLAPEGLPQIDGVVDYDQDDFLGVRAGDGLYRFFRGYGERVIVQHHIFSDVDEQQAIESWQGWLDRLFTR